MFPSMGGGGGMVVHHHNDHEINASLAEAEARVAITDDDESDDDDINNSDEVSEVSIFPFRPFFEQSPNYFRLDALCRR